MVKRKVQHVTSIPVTEKKLKGNNTVESTTQIPCDATDVAAAFELLGQSMNMLAEQLSETGSTKVVVQKHVWQPLIANEDPAPLLLDSFMSGVSALLALFMKESSADDVSPTTSNLAGSMMENLVNFMPVIEQ